MALIRSGSEECHCLPPAVHLEMSCRRHVLDLFPDQSVSIHRLVCRNGQHQEGTVPQLTVWADASCMYHNDTRRISYLVNDLFMSSSW